MALTNFSPWVFVIGVLQLHVCWSSIDGDMGKANFDDTCVPNSCSQPAFKDGLPAFPCTIGHQNACDAAAVKYHEASATAAFYSFALLATIGTYMRHYKDKPATNPSLNFSLTTPYGGEESLKTKSIQVDFNSPNEFGGDVFYMENPRCRLFDFSNATRQTYDIHHDREISYECLVGLSIANEITYYYRMKLTAYPSRARAEYSIVVHKEPRTDAKYRIVMAVAAIAVRCSVHVVWERPPAKFNVTSYVITLSEGKKVVGTKQTLFGSEILEFLELVPGDYTVEVASKTTGETTPFAATRSRSVRLIYHTVETPAPGDEDMLKIVLAAVSGSVLAVIVVILSLYWYYRARRNNYHDRRGPTDCQYRTREVLIVSLICDDDTVNKLSSVVRDILHTKVAKSQDHSGNLSSSELAKYFRILVICSDASTKAVNRDDVEHFNHYFSKTLNMVEGKPSLYSKLCIACIDKKPHSHLSILPSGRTRMDWRSSVLQILGKQNNKVFCLPEDSTELGKKLKGSNVSDVDWDSFQDTVNRVWQQAEHYTLNSSQAPEGGRCMPDIPEEPGFDSVSQAASNTKPPIYKILHKYTTSASSIDSTVNSMSMHDSQDLSPEQFGIGKHQSPGEFRPEGKQYRGAYRGKEQRRYNKPRKLYDYDMSCTTLHSTDLYQSYKTLPSEDIPLGDIDVMPESGFESYGVVFSSNTHDHPPQSEIIGEDNPRYQQDIQGHQWGPQIPTRNNPRAFHIFSHDSHLETDAYTIPIKDQHSTCVHAGYSDLQHVPDSGFDSRLSTVGGSIHSSNRNTVLRHAYEIPMATSVHNCVPMSAKPGHVSQGYPASQSKTPPEMKRQISLGYGSVNEDDLFGSGVSTPLLPKDHISDRVMSPPHLTSNADNVSFIGPESDRGSFYEYYIDDNESGECHIVPKHNPHFNIHEQMPLSDESIVMTAGHLGSRHNSAPDSFVEEDTLTKDHQCPSDMHQSPQPKNSNLTEAVEHYHSPQNIKTNVTQVFGHYHHPEQMYPSSTQDEGHLHCPQHINPKQTQAPQREPQHVYHQRHNGPQMGSPKVAWLEHNDLSTPHPDMVHHLTPQSGSDPTHLHHDPVLKTITASDDRDRKTLITRIYEPCNSGDLELQTLPGQVHHGGVRPKIKNPQKIIK